LKLIWSVLLKFEPFRKRILGHLRAVYFHEFDHTIPLGNDYWVHLQENDAYDSFSEIFIQKEYKNHIPDEPISRVLDIGAHYGYFSLWLQSQHPEIEIHSLMIEPSLRCQKSLKKLINHPKLNGRFTYLQKLIDAPEKGTSFFYDRPHMASSRFILDEEEQPIRVSTLQEKDVMESFHPPYDLVKIDIEGSEWHFLNNFGETLYHTKFLVLEWHSWHEGGGGVEQIRKRLSSLGFHIENESSPVPATGRNGEVGLISATRRNEER